MILTHPLATLFGVALGAEAAHALDSQCRSGPQQLLSEQTPICYQGEHVRPTPKQAQTSYDDPTWSHAPFCVSRGSKTYCTHTTAKFPRENHSHGLSIIADPAAGEAISKLISVASNAEYVSQDGLEVHDIPGKGKGLITTRPIKKGETIMLDSPRIIASSEFPKHVPQSQGQSLLENAISRLPDEDREAVLRLDKSLGGTDFEDVMKTNSFACQPSDGSVGEGYMCLFPSVSRINHACRPNSHARFTPANLLMDIRALRDIAPGEEISISYGQIDLQYAERQQLYKHGWGFTCTCDLCTASSYEIKGSDQRRERFKKLKETLNSLTAESYDAQQIIAWEKEVLELSKKEGLETLVAEDYERMAYVYQASGMKSEAKMWAGRAKRTIADWVYVEGGPDNDVVRVEGLLRELG